MHTVNFNGMRPICSEFYSNPSCKICTQRKAKENLVNTKVKVNSTESTRTCKLTNAQLLGILRIRCYFILLNKNNNILLQYFFEFAMKLQLLNGFAIYVIRFRIIFSFLFLVLFLLFGEYYQCCTVAVSMFEIFLFNGLCFEQLLE